MSHPNIEALAEAILGPASGSQSTSLQAAEETGLTPEQIERLEALRPISLAAAIGDAAAIQRIALAAGTSEWIRARAVHTLRSMGTGAALHALSVVLADAGSARLRPADTVVEETMRRVSALAHALGASVEQALSRVRSLTSMPVPARAALAAAGAGAVTALAQGEIDEELTYELYEQNDGVYVRLEAGGAAAAAFSGREAAVVFRETGSEAPVVRSLKLVPLSAGAAGVDTFLTGRLERGTELSVFVLDRADQADAGDACR